MNMLSCLVGLSLAAADPLVVEVVAGHRANFGRVRTLRAVFNTRSGLEGNPQVFERTALVYLRDPDGVLVRDGGGGKITFDYALLDGETRTLIRDQSAQAKAARMHVQGTRVPSERSLSNFNLWFTMGAEFTGNDLRPRSLGTVVSESDPPAQASRETRDGVPVIKIVRQGKSPEGTPARIQDWYDPARGYVIVRSEWTGGGSGTTEWLEFKAVADGVWFPMRQVSSGKITAGRTFAEAVVTELSVNQPLPAGGTTILSLPAGTPVRDELRASQYEANPDWTPAGPEKPWQRLVVPTPADPGPYTGTSTAAPVGWSRWLLYAAAALVGVGLIGLVARRILARRAEVAT